MRFPIRYFATTLMLVLLLLGLFACSRPSEESPQATAPAVAEPAPAAPAAEQPAKTGAAAPAPVKPETAPERTAKKPTPAPTAVSPNNISPAPPPPPEVVKIPAGTTLTVTMIDAVGTDTNKAGDTFLASIAEPVVINGKTVLEKGMKVQGFVEALDEPGRVKGKAAITLVLTQIIGRNKAQPISTQPFSVAAEAGTKKDAVKVGAGAAVGALVGALAGGKKGAALGAAVGGGAGTTAVLATKGNHIRIDSETRVNFVTKNDVEIEMTKSTS